MAKKMPAGQFAAALGAACGRKDGYIMGATGQDPKKWSAGSWWYTQYTRASQRKKALYWREHAARVWDCNGLAEGLYKDYAGVDINTKARYNYAQWCGPKGRGMIPAALRVPGAAVFWGDDGKPSTIHHVAYLYQPVNPSKPEGDWLLIEARGVMYGVVTTRLSGRKPNFWGWMTKYFDYAGAPGDGDGRWVVITGGTVNVRAQPGVSARILGVARKGESLPWLGKTDGGWHAVRWKDREAWVSGKYGRLTQ